MLKGHSLVYFAPGPWDGLWRNRHQLMSVFGRQNKVLYVEHRSHLRPTLADFRRGEAGLPDLFRSCVRHIADDLFVFRYPVWAPISGRFPLREVTGIIRRLAIRQAVHKLGMSQPIVWFSKPDMLDLIDEIADASLFLYHVVDEYTAYSDVTADRRRRIEVQEQEMMAQVDAVIVVSKRLYDAKHPFNANTYLVPNGVDYQAYSAALLDSGLPPDLSAIRTPRLGYSGLIGDRLNLQMLKTLAEENPHWSMVFLGEARVEEQAQTWQSLLMLPNVHYLGQVDVSEVPHYLKGFQVGLMPYALGRESENVSPLKLYDYLAAGLPVASVDIPAAREFRSLVHLAGGTHSLAQAVRAALADTGPERREARRQAAAEHTWEARVEQLSALIEERIAAKAGTE